MRTCVVHGCQGVGQPMLVYTLGREFPICERHREFIHELDLEALAERLSPEEMRYRSPMGRIVAYSEVFSEWSDNEEDIPAAQAAINVLSGKFLERRDLREKAVGVIECHPDGNRVIWADPYLAPEFSSFLDDEETTLAPYEAPEAMNRLKHVSREQPDGVPAWYAVQTYFGYELKVKANLERRIEVLGLQELIQRVEVPVDGETVYRDGKRYVVALKRYPGYVFVRMVMNDDTWNVVRSVPGVVRFVGVGNRAAAL